VNINKPLKTLSIIIPAYNEAKTIHLILDKVIGVELAQNIQKEIIIIDGCSSDLQTSYTCLDQIPYDWD